MRIRRLTCEGCELRIPRSNSCLTSHWSVLYYIYNLQGSARWNRSSRYNIYSFQVVPVQPTRETFDIRTALWVVNINTQVRRMEGKSASAASFQSIRAHTPFWPMQDPLWSTTALRSFFTKFLQALLRHNVVRKREMRRRERVRVREPGGCSCKAPVHAKYIFIILLLRNSAFYGIERERERGVRISSGSPTILAVYMLPVYDAAQEQIAFWFALNREKLWTRERWRLPFRGWW